MNAAFLLVATAFVTGSDPVQAAPAPVAAPIVSGCGCSTCDNGCNSCGSTKLFGGFRGLFNRGSDCGCDTCGSKKLFSGLGSGCGCGGGFSLGLRERFAHKSCDTCNTCNECAHEKSCGCGIMESPLSRLGGLFRKRDRGCGCDTCNTCSTCGGAIQGAPVAPIPAGAKPAAPMPAAPKPMPAAPAKPTVGQLTPTSNLIIE